MPHGYELKTDRANQVHYKGGDRILIAVERGGVWEAIVKEQQMLGENTIKLGDFPTKPMAKGALENWMAENPVNSGEFGFDMDAGGGLL